MITTHLICPKCKYHTTTDEHGQRRMADHLADDHGVTTAPDPGTDANVATFVAMAGRIHDLEAELAARSAPALVRTITDDDLRAAAILVVPITAVANDEDGARLIDALGNRCAHLGIGRRPLVLAIDDPANIRTLDHETAAALVADLRERFDL